MKKTRATLMLLCLAVMVVAGPCDAWLYDSGVPNFAGPILSESSLQEVAGIFKLSSDSYGTSFGAAVSRAYGPASAGFTISLCTWSWTNYSPGPAIDKWTIIPDPGAGLLKYYYGTAAAPIALDADVYYCLVVAPNDPAFAGPISYTLKSGLYYGWGTYDHGASWGVLSYPVCIRVDGYVPEPGSLWVVLAGLSAAGFQLRAKPDREEVGVHHHEAQPDHAA